MRKSFHALSGLVWNRIGDDPMNGDVYIFVNKRRNRIKLLHYEAGGMVIYAKMLDRGTFVMPILGSNDVVTSSIKWEDLLKMVEGIMADPDSRQARLEWLRNLWKNLTENGKKNAIWLAYLAFFRIFILLKINEKWHPDRDHSSPSSRDRSTQKTGRQS